MAGVTGGASVGVVFSGETAFSMAPATMDLTGSASSTGFGSGAVAGAGAGAGLVQVPERQVPAAQVRLRRCGAGAGAGLLQVPAQR